ncbi:hypothetical protein [Vulcanisaeta thermophila]|uniref:hypothetical protein n=1 Tax=Vulcanisaeta thermophila TaxID=867917 RepID=UPI0008533A4A|nr:hypothetical protein [Vulcanisaeta thermophila]
MSRYHDEVIKALIEEYKSRFINLIMHYCTCKREYEGKSELLDIINIESEVKRCIDERRECDLGKVKVYVNRKFLRTEVYLLVNGRRMSVSEFENLLVTLKSFMEWYNNDCTIDSIMTPLVGTDFFDDVRELISENVELLNRVCNGAAVNGDVINVGSYKLPGYVIQGFINALMDAPRGVKA